MKKYYDESVLASYLTHQPPHLALIRCIEAVYYKQHQIKGRVLDVGCGDGQFTSSVYPESVIDLGIDLPESLWREAKIKSNYKKIRVYDGQKIPGNESSFDTIICNCVLEHVPKVESLLKEMNRVMSVGGKLITTVVTDDYGDDYLGTRIFGNSYKDWFNKKSQHVSQTSINEWKKRYKKAGFNIVESSIYMNHEGLIRWFEISHYWGVINLISRVLTGKWVSIVSKWSNSLWLQATKLIFKNPGKIVDSPYLFLVAEKIRT